MNPTDFEVLDLCCVEIAGDMTGGGNEAAIPESGTYVGLAHVSVIAPQDVTTAFVTESDVDLNQPVWTPLPLDDIAFDAGNWRWSSSFPTRLYSEIHQRANVKVEGAFVGGAATEGLFVRVGLNGEFVMTPNPIDAVDTGTLGRGNTHIDFVLELLEGQYIELAAENANGTTTPITTQTGSDRPYFQLSTVDSITEAHVELRLVNDDGSLDQSVDSLYTSVMQDCMIGGIFTAKAGQNVHVAGMGPERWGAVVKVLSIWSIDLDHQWDNCGGG